MSKLSVIVPVYKTEEKLLRGCIDSIVSQKSDQFELEIILVDDGCPENGAVCEEYARLLGDGLVMKVLHRENGGPGAARNTGLGAVTGDYLAFADADDRVMPGIYSKVIGLLDSTPSDDCVIYSFVAITKGGPVTHRVTEGSAGGLSTSRMPARRALRIIAGDNFKCGGGYLWTKVFRVASLRRAHGGRLPLFDEELYAYEDKLWCMTALEGLGNVLLLPDPGYAYQNDSPSISNGEAAVSARQTNVYLAFDRMSALARQVDPAAEKRLLTHDFKIVFTDLRRLSGEEGTDAYAAAKERMRSILGRLSSSDLDRIRDKAAYRYMKFRFGRN